jgi:hypothetical protein
MGYTRMRRQERYGIPLITVTVMARELAVLHVGYTTYYVCFMQDLTVGTVSGTLQLGSEIEREGYCKSRAMDFSRKYISQGGP